MVVWECFLNIKDGDGHSGDGWVPQVDGLIKADQWRWAQVEMGEGVLSLMVWVKAGMFLPV